MKQLSGVNIRKYFSIMLRLLLLQSGSS
jgi:hypothetical protein